MIFTYSSIIKNKLKNNNELYLDYYMKGLNAIKQFIIFSAGNINENFIDGLIQNKNIQIVFYLSDTKFSLKHCKGIIIYERVYNPKNKENKIYLLLLTINKHFRNYGYGKHFMGEFITHVEKLNLSNKRLILHSISSSVEFYKSLGLEEVPDNPYNYRKLFKYEKYDKEAIILHMKIT